MRKRLLGASHDAGGAAEGGVDAKLAREGLDARLVDGRGGHDLVSQPGDVIDLVLWSHTPEGGQTRASSAHA